MTNNSDSDNGNNSADIKVPIGRELGAVGVFAASILVLLIIAIPNFMSQDTSQKSYTLSLNGQPMYSNYPVSVFVDDSQIINIFGLSLSGKESITLTDMIGETGNIKSTNIEHKVYPKKNPQNETEPTRVSLITSATKPGLFQGLMLFTESKNSTLTSIPLTLSSDTVTNYAVIWILVGVFSSFIFWEFIKVNQKKVVRKKLVPLRLQANSLHNGALAKNMVERVKNERIDDYLQKRYSTKAGAGRIAFVDIVSVAFGVGVGFIALLNNDYVTSIRLITLEVIIVLFGIGLGIGSIKELVDKAD
jgi:hypothetical protein